MQRCEVTGTADLEAVELKIREWERKKYRGERRECIFLLLLVAGFMGFIMYEFVHIFGLFNGICAGVLVSALFVGLGHECLFDLKETCLDMRNKKRVKPWKWKITYSWPFPIERAAVQPKKVNLWEMELTPMEKFTFLGKDKELYETFLDHDELFLCYRTVDNEIEEFYILLTDFEVKKKLGIVVPIVDLEQRKILKPYRSVE